ncbi:1,4-beta-xylanase [Niastella koreensis]|uniref:Alpha/beta hydrolase n=2 Tax=Niastella koreensis TaxID=354356 RepID=G8T9V0_NIAKG|nr:alpha/beta hydrolase [Niastella koreensis]AEW01294.1 alpha/beta hydrolase [Niastella koreensis GR20-10]OQP46372.1 1,4-beta-xylanase [Niastella koreensis]
MKKLLSLSVTLICFALITCAQTVMPLYPDSIPNSKPVPDEEKADTNASGRIMISKVSRPTLTVYLPPKEKANGAAVIVIPGGGYRNVAAVHEGSEVAQRFNEMGVTAFVLKYRLPSDVTMVNKEIGPVQDAQRAIQVVRERAKEWGIDKNRVGIIGFSAGGHLASTAGTHFNHAYIDAGKKANLRPDFMILVYPVISFADSICHMGSRENLIGKDPSPQKKEEYSNELQVTKKTPPTYLVHAEDDSTVKVQNMLLFATALQKNKVPFDFYLYEKGGHGFGLVNKTSEVKWMDLVQEWMTKSGWMK